MTVGNQNANHVAALSHSTEDADTIVHEREGVKEKRVYTSAEESDGGEADRGCEKADSSDGRGSGYALAEL